MTTTASAIYENGLLRPLVPLPLAEGARVEVMVTDDNPSSQPAGANCAADYLREIAALPVESANDGFSGRDHDRILYGKPGGAS